MESATILRDLVLLFALGALAAVVFERLRLPPLVGYMLTGVAIGPHALGLVRATDEVQPLAEIGVVLLLFTIGLQFSLRELLKLRRTVLVGGGLQVGITIVLVALLTASSEPWRRALFLGMLAAHSSSTLILRLLSHRGELDSLHARAALGVALFQDLSVVPMVLAVPLLAGAGQPRWEVARSVATMIAFLGGALLAARTVVPRLLERVVRTGQREAFLLAVIALCFGAAWAAAAAGLPLATGAFIAGLVVSESEYSHQTLGEVLPLREIFVSLFFAAVGMLLDPRAFAAAAGPLLALVAAVVAVKIVAGTGALLAVGHSARTAARAGVVMAQVGEFAFVLAIAGARVGLLDDRLMQIVLTVAVGSMLATPLLLPLGGRLAALIERALPALARLGEAPAGTGRGDEPRADHVIIVGHGMNGRNLARVLARNDVPFRIVEMNPEIVRAERARGRAVVFGDATRPEVLEAAGIRGARVVAIAISDAAATRSAVALARRLNPHAHLIVRTRYVGEMQALLALGTDEVIAEEFETSIEIFSRVLQRYLVPRVVIERNVAEVREDAYEMFRTLDDAAAARSAAIGAVVPGVAMDLVAVEDGSDVAGCRLADSALRERYGVTVVAIRGADGRVVVTPGADDVLAPGSAALLMARHEQLAEAARAFAAPRRGNGTPLPPPYLEPGGVVA